MASAAIHKVTIYPLAIPLRQKVSHAAHQRAISDTVVVAIELQSGHVGYGETLARPYVSGEPPESVIESVERIFNPIMLEMNPAHFPAALEMIDALPFADDQGHLITAARAAVELALLDVYARHFDRPLSEVPAWMGLSRFGTPGSSQTVRYSGVLASSTISSTMKKLRLMWWYGLRNYKLKIGYPDDAERLAAVFKRMGRAISKGRATLRVDANGIWSKEDAIEQLADLGNFPLAGIEQPLAKGDEANLPIVHDLAGAPLFFDESLVTMADAEQLFELGVADGFNIRISKCGGLMPALRLASFAIKHNVRIQLGCMVGETSILSAAGRRFLEWAPHVAFAEGWFGSFLMQRDVVTKPLRFGYGGKGGPLGEAGMGVDVLPQQLEDLSAEDPIEVYF